MGNLIEAPGVWVDDQGYRRGPDGEYLAMHWRPSRCERTRLTPADLITHPKTGDRWCPDCWPLQQRFFRGL